MAEFRSARTLGFVLLAWGALGVLAIGGLLALVGAPWSPEDTWQLPTTGSPMGRFAAVGLAGAALSLLAGVALVRSWAPGRLLGLLASVVSLVTVPIGTAVGIYGLIVLLGGEKRAPKAMQPG